MNKYYYDRVNGNCYIKFDDLNINPNLYLFLKFMILFLGYGLFSIILQTLAVSFMNGIHKTLAGTILQTLIMIISLLYLKYLRSIDFTKLILNTIMFITGIDRSFRMRREITIYKISMDYKFLTQKTKTIYVFIVLAVVALSIYVFISPVLYSISLQTISIVEYILIYMIFNLFYDKRYYLFLLNIM